MEWVWVFLGLMLIVILVAFYAYSPEKEVPEITDELKEEQKRTSVGNFKIAYKKMGQSGPPLILIHGIGASTFCWRHIQPLLAENFVTYAIDLPGFGKSSKLPKESYGLDAQMDRLERFIEEEHLERPYIVGCSMGGALAFQLKERSPQNYMKVLAINPALSPKLIPFNTTFLSRMSKTFTKVVNYNFVQQVMYRVFNDHSLIYDSSINAYLAPYKDNPKAIECFLKATELIRDKRLNKKLTGPVDDYSIIYCPLDKMVKPQHIQPFFDLNPKVQVTLHKSAGHHLMEEKPRWTYDQICQFFIETEV